MNKYQTGNDNSLCYLPRGTDCKLVMSSGSPKLRTAPNSEAQVSPLQQAKAPGTMRKFGKFRFLC